MAGLTITTGAMQGQRIECDRPLVIGREDVGEGVDVVIDDAEMSRRHAVVAPVGAGLEIEDLGSLNGTFVNGDRISGKVILEPDAEVRIGTTRFTVQLPPVDAPIASPSDRTVISQSVTPASDEPVAEPDQRTVVRGQPVAPAADAETPSDEPVVPLDQPTVVRGQPVAPAADAETPSDEPVVPLDQPTVVRGQPVAPAADAETPSDEPVAAVEQPTVARSAPIVPDVAKTALRDQPLISPQEPTVVRDAVKGLPTAQPGGPGAPPGGPPKIPAPVRMVMKSPAGKLLLPIMLKLPPKARPLVPLLFVLLLVAIVVVIVLLVV